MNSLQRKLLNCAVTHMFNISQMKKKFKLTQLYNKIIFYSTR